MKYKGDEEAGKARWMNPGTECSFVKKRGTRGEYLFSAEELRRGSFILSPGLAAAYNAEAFVDTESSSFGAGTIFPPVGILFM